VIYEFDLVAESGELRFVGRGFERATFLLSEFQPATEFDEISARGDGDPESNAGWLTWPRPVHDREWVDVDGSAWRMRGGPLDAKQARRLMKRADVHVVRAYELNVAEVRGAERDALLARVEEFFAGNAPANSEFEPGDFRDQNHRVMLMVQESC